MAYNTIAVSFALELIFSKLYPKSRFRKAVFLYPVCQRVSSFNSMRVTVVGQGTDTSTFAVQFSNA